MAQKPPGAWMASPLIQKVEVGVGVSAYPAGVFDGASDADVVEGEVLLLDHVRLHQRRTEAVDHLLVLCSGKHAYISSDDGLAFKDCCTTLLRQEDIVV